MKFVFAYHGGEMPASEEDQQAAFAAWGEWLGELGSAVLDPGNPIGPSASVDSGGSADGGGANPVTGYSLIDADDLNAAVEIAKTCPQVTLHGGSVEVGQAVDIPL